MSGGGSQDQNLILLDGIPIFSPFHLGGLFSVFNAEMIDRALSGHLTLTSRGDSRIVPDFVGFAQNTPQQDHAAWIAGRLAARLGLDRATARQAAIATWRTDLHDTALRAIPGYSPRPDAMTHSFDGQEFSPSLQE